MTRRYLAVGWPALRRRPLATLMRLPVLLYGYTLSGFVGRGCRHLPTCSEYMDEALDRHGAWAGLWMGTARLCRCHPWGTSGLDPVPERLNPRARWFTPWWHGRWRSTEPSAFRCDAITAEGTGRRS